MKNFFLFIIITFSLLIGVCFAQKKQNIYFLKNNGSEVKLKDSADFIRVIQEPDSGSTFYNLFEYYKDGTKKRLGQLSSFMPKLVFEGTSISFYENTKRKEILTYSQGKQIGLRYYYYNNGRLKESRDEKSKLVSFYDSSGVQLLIEGTGYYKVSGQENTFSEEGTYVNGDKHGIWKGLSSDQKNSFTEEYLNGKLVSGVARLESGDTYKYTTSEEMPTFRGGMNEFYTYVAKNFRYPKDAIAFNLSGKVMLSFVVEKNGSLNDIKLKKDLGLGTGEEAMRVVRSSPKWKPGRQHGIPVRVLYTLPLALNSYMEHH